MPDFDSHEIKILEESLTPTPFPIPRGTRRVANRELYQKLTARLLSTLKAIQFVSIYLKLNWRNQKKLVNFALGAELLCEKTRSLNFLIKVIVARRREKEFGKYSRNLSIKICSQKKIALA